MEINKLISDYLEENNSHIVVPDLGCFTIVNKPSEIKDGIVLPPVKTVVFDSEHSDDDNVFSSYIAKKRSITQEQAKEEIRSFYNKYFIQKLTLNLRPITFSNLGTFTLNNGNILFEPVPDLFKENFGLGNAYISSKPQKESPKHAVNEKQEEEASFKPVTPAEPLIPPTPPTPPPTPTASAVTKAPSAPAVTKAPSAPVTQAPKAPPVVETQKKEQEPSEKKEKRFRENTERLRSVPVVERQAPPVSQKESRKKSNTMQKEQAVKKEKTTSGIRSYLWLGLVLLISAGLGVGGYFGYPHVAPYVPASISSLSVPSFNIPFISKRTADDAQQTAMLPADEPVVDSVSDTNDSVSDTNDFVSDTLSVDNTQTLDGATDIRNALNPAESQPTTPTQTQAQAQPSSTPSQATTQAQTPPPAMQPIASSGQGRWAVIIGSFISRQNAETFVRMVQAEDGINCEIIESGSQRHRVSAGRFETEAEANRLASQIRARREVWVARL